MKKLIILAVCIFALTATASAQVPSSPVKLYAGGLFSLPQGPDAFNDAFNTGFHGFVGVGKDLSPMFQLVGKVEYHSFGFNFDDAGINNADGGSLNAWLFGADARISPSLPAAPIKPFIFGGVGFASVKQSEFESSDLSLATSLNQTTGTSSTDLFFNVGVGADLFSTPAMTIFAQGKYVSIQTEGDATSIIPISLGVRFF